MPSPISWQLSFPGCCLVAGEPSEHWIVIWPAEYSLKLCNKHIAIAQFLCEVTDSLNGRRQTYGILAYLSPIMTHPGDESRWYADAFKTLFPFSFLLKRANGDSNQVAFLSEPMVYILVQRQSVLNPVAK
jgi:hypothetical protein